MFRAEPFTNDKITGDENRAYVPRGTLAEHFRNIKRFADVFRAEQSVP